MGTDGVNRLFSNDNPLLRGIRDLGLGWWVPFRGCAAPAYAKPQG